LGLLASVAILIDVYAGTGYAGLIVDFAPLLDIELIAPASVLPDIAPYRDLSGINGELARAATAIGAGALGGEILHILTK